MCKTRNIIALTITLLIVLGCQLFAFNLRGDLNGDSKVDVNDLLLMAEHWLKNDCTDPACGQVTGDEAVNLQDFSGLSGNWLADHSRPVITEFMASNSSTLIDEDNEYPDWIEIFNPTDKAFNLTGWYLTDNKDNLTKWEFPEVELGSGEFLLVYASGKDRRVVGQPLHTNFPLDKEGEYLALVAGDGITIACEYAPQFPQQLGDISYGLAQFATSMISAGHEVSYHVPASDDAGASWTALDFDDSQWQTGLTSLGFAFGTTEIPQEGLVAHWKLDESEGKIASEETGNYDGILANGPSWVSGIVDGGLAFDGSDDYVNCGTEPGSAYDLSFAFWMKADKLGYQIPINKLPESGAAGWNIKLRPESENNALHFRIGSSSDYGGWPDALQVYNAYAVDEWVHVACTFDSAATTGKIYINGELKDTETVTGRTVNNTDTTLFLGKGSNEPFAGVLDEVCIYNRALIQEEIETLVNVTGDDTFGTNVQEQMHNINASLWLRIGFEIEEPGLFDALSLRMSYEDGFVAYLNGHEVARRNAPASVQWNSAALSDRPLEDSLTFEEINLMGFLNLLQSGRNVLAIHGLNDSTDNGSFLILPELMAASRLGVPQYFTTATPGTFNVSGAIDIVENVEFGTERGFFEDEFQLALFNGTDGAEIRYTRDGSRPTITYGTVYSEPIPITTTVTVRAGAFKAGWLDSEIKTHTYIFTDGEPPNGVVNQPANPPGFPGGFDYAMDPEVLDDSLYQKIIHECLKAIPTMSLVTNMENMFGSASGIYANPYNLGIEWERPVSLEYFDPDTGESIQADAGIRIHGAYSRGNKKKSFRLYFRGIYGPTKLEFPLIERADVQRHDKLVLRANANDAWEFSSANNAQTLLRDEFNRRSFAEMGHLNGLGIHVHLYINGLYWGLYNLTERYDAEFCVEHMGGLEQDYDVLKNGDWMSPMEVIDGDKNAWNVMTAIARAGPPTTNAYEGIRQYLDVENLIDYMIQYIYRGDDEPKHHHAYRRREPGNLFRFLSWDCEWALGIHFDGIWKLDNNRVNVDVYDQPTELYTWLRDNAEFRLLFADHVHRHFFNDGQLYPQANIDRYLSLIGETEQAIVGESARWGDASRSNPFTREGDWTPANNWLLNTFFPQRHTIVLQQFRDNDLYPNVETPVFHINGQYQHGGEISVDDNVSMSAMSVAIWLTLDGADPRLPGGTVNTPHAIEYDGPFTLNESTHIKARVLDGGVWSALNEAVFAMGPVVENLRITEIMYHPPDAPVSDPNAEYIELKNIGPESINLALVRFTNGIDFTFPSRQLDPNDYVLVVLDEAVFAAQHPGLTGLVAGEYNGRFDNVGERIVLEDAIGRTIHEFDYKDGWYEITDGIGFSLTIKDPTSGDPNSWDEKEGWRPSASIGGSPGEDDSGQVPELGAIKINELLAHSDVVYTYDWIELYNTTDTAINIGGWYLSDDDNNLKKYTIPDGTSIDAYDYYVFYENLHFGVGNPADPANVPFALSENGETLYLNSGLGGVLTGYSEEEAFDASETDIPFGRYQKSTGTFNFVAMSSPTPGWANAYPKVGPVVISEIMYHPQTEGDAEYVELLNISGSTVTLQEWDNVHGIYVPWRFTDSGGITYDFPLSTTIDAGEKILLVKNLIVFEFEFGGSVPGDKFEWGDGKLDNGGEKIELSMPGDLEGFIRYYIRVDRVNYSDGSHPVGDDPWPTEPDGTGDSLTRIVSSDYGNDVANWQSETPTPGE